MLGDLTVWDGQKEVRLFSWYERFWRFITGKNSQRAYDNVVKRIEAEEFAIRQSMIQRELNRCKELEYGEIRTQLGGEHD